MRDQLEALSCLYNCFCACFVEVTRELMAPGKLPGCSGTRNLHDNLADLRAQVAANQRVSAFVTD